MDSRLLASLNFQASSTGDPVLWARTLCRAASHFARQGSAAEALKSIAVVRSQFGHEIPPEVTCWLMLAEGVLHYFQKRPREAYDRIQRAYGLAVALKIDSALPSCAAWMAHTEFIESKYEPMAIHLEQALTSAQPQDHQAMARAALVLAAAFHLANDFESARPWYEQARQRAATEGDETTISAMLYNVAAMRAANARLADTFGVQDSGETQRAAMELSSSLNYDAAIGSTSLTILSQMLNGLILTLSKRYADALKIFIEIDKSTSEIAELSLITIDTAWCTANLGDFEKAWQFAMLAGNQSREKSEPDDVAYINSRVSQIAELCGRSGATSSYRATANAALASHRQFQATLRSRLKAIRFS